jgi:CysZ protein
MEAIQSFFSSFSYAVRLVWDKKLFWYFIPSIFIAVIFYLLFSGGSWISQGASFMEDWWLIGWILGAFKSLFAFIGFMLFEFILLVLFAPITALLAERTREEITGESIPFSVAIFMSAFKRMLVILTTAFLTQLLITVILWFLSFLLGDLFYTIASMINIAFFIGFSYFDFALELDEISAKESRKFGRKNWLACILIGLVFSAGIYIPQTYGIMILYLITISFLPNVLAITATKMYYNIKKG